MPLGQPRGRMTYVRIKLQHETHLLWVEKKHLLGVTSDDTLAHHLLTETTTRNATETNHASFSCSDVMTEGLCVSDTIVKWVYITHGVTLKRYVTPARHVLQSSLSVFLLQHL